MTANERKRKERARRDKAGYVRYELWIKRKWLTSLKIAVAAHVAKLEKGE